VRKNQVLNISQTLSDFFLWCSATDLDVLAKCPYSEISRRQLLGASVFLSAIIAYFAAYYALSLLRKEIWLIGLLAFLWSASIFLLNRFIFLIPLRKYDLSNNKIRINYATSIVLVVIKSLTAVIIATPLQLRLFESEIQQEIMRTNIVNIDRIRLRYESLFKYIEDEREKLRIERISQLEPLFRTKEKLRESILAETYRTKDGRSGLGQKARSLKNYLKQISIEINDLETKFDSQLRDLEIQKEGLDKKRTLEVDAAYKSYRDTSSVHNKGSDLLAKIIAFHKIQDDSYIETFSRIILFLLDIIKK
jgi:hypothetical protein